MGVSFGSFNDICLTAALVICPLVGSDQGVEPVCYSRNVDVGGTLIFQPCESGVCFSLPHVCAFGSAFVDGRTMSRRNVLFMHTDRGFGRCLTDLTPIMVTLLTFSLLSSHELRAYSCNNNDGHYDLPYPEQIHRRRSASLSFTCPRDDRADTWSHSTGRKEIVMFFWMYMIIELLAMFLDSGIIPTSNVSYTVSRVHSVVHSQTPTSCMSTVVCRCVHWFGSRCVRVFAHQWIRRVPVC